MKIGWIRWDCGTYGLQIEDDNSRWGFYLAAAGGTWDGGFGGPSAEWTLVSADEVPAAAREELLDECDDEILAELEGK